MQEIIINPAYAQLDVDGEFHITGDVALARLTEPVVQPAANNSCRFLPKRPAPRFAFGVCLCPKPRRFWSCLTPFNPALLLNGTERSVGFGRLSQQHPRFTRLQSVRAATPPCFAGPRAH